MLGFLKKLIEEKDEKEQNDLRIKVFANRCSRLKPSNVLCHNCVKSCPKEAIDLRNRVRILADKCNSCEVCIDVCPADVFLIPAAKKEENISRRDFLQSFRFKE